MSAIARSLARPLVAAVAIGYFSLLVFLLVLQHLSPVVVLALTVGAIGLLLIALNPYWGLHVFIMILFFEDIAATREGLTAMQVLGGIVFSGWLLNAALRRRSPIRFSSLVLIGLLFIAWCGATIPSALDVDEAASRLGTFTQLVIAALMFASVVDDRGKVRGIFTAIVVWSFTATALAIAEYYLGMTLVAVGLVGNRNLLAIYINCAIVCAYLLHQAAQNRRARIMLALALPVFFLGLGLTFSRTGLVVQAVALLLVWYRVARERGFLILAGSVAALSLITLLLPANFYKRASSIVPAIQRQEDTFGVRVRIWKSGLRMIQDRPVFGVGVGNFSVGIQRYNRGEVLIAGLGAHNAYVGLAAETGLVGVCLFVAILLSALTQARKALRGAKAAGAKDLEMFAVMCEISLIVFTIGGLTGSVEGQKYLWLLIGMGFALVRITPTRVEVRRPETSLQGAPAPWTMAAGDSK